MASAATPGHGLAVADTLEDLERWATDPSCAGPTKSAKLKAMWRSIRGPLVALAAGGLLVLLANWLDTGSWSAREAALLIGVVALFIVLPAAVIWLVVV